jgi:hypothetical protein
MAKSLTETLTDYFNGNSVFVLHDPLDRIMDGVILRVHCYKWSGEVSLNAAAFGLSSDEYKQVQQEMRLRFGSINLLPEEVRSRFTRIEAQVRNLPIKWGRITHWGQWVPLQAMDRVKADFETAEREWNEALCDLADNYRTYRDQAADQLAVFAEAAWRTHNRMEGRLTEEQYTDMDTFVDALVARIMSDYPRKPELGARFHLAYEVTFLETPTAETERTEQARYIVEQNDMRLEKLRREAELSRLESEEQRQRRIKEIDTLKLQNEQKNRLLEEHERRLRSELDQTRRRLIDQIYRGYAEDIRQRLHRSLMFLTETIRKGGDIKIPGSAARSLKTVLDEISVLGMQEDTEIREMAERLGQIAENTQTIKSQQVQQQIEDFATLLQVSIHQLGATPRMPPERETVMDVKTELPFDDVEELRKEVRQRRERSGLSVSLAEALVENEATPRQRRQRLAP